MIVCIIDAPLISTQGLVCNHEDNISRYGCGEQAEEKKDQPNEQIIIIGIFECKEAHD